jgi:hypothetical protein
MEGHSSFTTVFIQSMAFETAITENRPDVSCKLDSFLGLRGQNEAH